MARNSDGSTDLTAPIEIVTDDVATSHDIAPPTGATVDKQEASIRFQLPETHLVDKRVLSSYCVMLYVKVCLRINTSWHITRNFRAAMDH